MPDYSYPSWLVPKTEPWQALVAGVQAGGVIAANRERGRALSLQAQHQALQDSLLQQKWQNDTQDMTAIREWWPVFSSADGDALKTLQPPALKNPQMMNQLHQLVAEKKMQYGTMQVADTLAQVDLSTPEGQAKYWATIRQNPAVVGKTGIDALMGPIKTAETLKRLEENAGNTAAIKNQDKAIAKEREALAIEATDPDKADQLRKDAAELRSTLTAPGESIEISTDSEGRPVYRVIKGPNAGKTPTDFSKPTMATASQIQQRLLASEKTMAMGAQLLGQLTSSDVGVKGFINQAIINEGLAQIFPDMAKGSVTEARTLLGKFNESAKKSITADPRISDKDEARYKKLLPKLEANESLGSAQKKIGKFMSEFRAESRIDAKAAGLPFPDWTLSVDELKAKIANKELSEDQALQILMKYHPTP